MGRYRLAEDMLSKWREIEQRGEIKLIVYQPADAGRFNFQRLRREMADQEAQGEVYVLTDDDMCPPTISGRQMFMPFATELVKLYSGQTVDGVDVPRFGILSAWPDPAHIAKWIPEKYVPYEDANVQEVHDVGGLRFCRKGCVEKWPEQTRPGYDAEHSEALRQSGYRVGYLKNIRSYHHGEGASDLYPETILV